MRPRHQHEDADDGPCDERGILKDGKSIRVSLFMRDGLSPVQQAVARESLRVTDGQGDTVGLHRPGFRLAATDARKIVKRDPRGRLEATHEEEEERHGTERQTSDGRQRAYDAYQTDLVTAYRRPVGFGSAPSITGFGERDSVGQRGGGTGMLDSEENAEDIARNAATHTESARRDHRTIDQMMRDHQDTMAEIYNNLDRDLAEKWRRW